MSLQDTFGDKETTRTKSFTLAIFKGRLKQVVVIPGVQPIQNGGCLFACLLYG